MDKAVREYLSKIGQRGGRNSRRQLSAEVARRMVLTREARRAFRRFYAQCFWSCDPEFVPTACDIAWVAEQLKKHGGRDAWEVSARLCGRPGGVLPRIETSSI